MPLTQMPKRSHCTPSPTSSPFFRACHETSKSPTLLCSACGGADLEYSPINPPSTRNYNPDTGNSRLLVSYVCSCGHRGSALHNIY